MLAKINILVIFSIVCGHCFAHDVKVVNQNIDNNVEIHHDLSQNSSDYIKYLGNEALFIKVGDSKVLFDPFFHQNLGIYQLVPETIKQNIFNGEAPYSNINAIFISHAHRDHFAVDELVKYLLKFKQVKLVASKQAIDKVRDYLKPIDESIKKERLIAIDLAFGDLPWQYSVGELTIDAVRIPHAGWPSRADVENLIFRVSINDSVTIMHMGDADPDDNHYLPYKSFWQKKVTDYNFPPYWFFFSAEGKDILDNIIAAKHNVGIHVPMKLPKQLVDSGRDYFSKPEQTKQLTKDSK
jgi:L-ascorbate metabolism protein UlaG (beta-lactamase superfamily)